MCTGTVFEGNPFCILHVQDKGDGFRLFEQLVADKLSKRDYVFTGAVFPEGTFTLNGDVDSADFSEAKFTGPAVFDNTNFCKEVNFSLAEFGDKASFTNTEFGKQANFTGATFSQEVSFFKAVFQGSANFEEAHFWRASFHDTKFSGDANFRATEFLHAAGFGGAVFRSAAVFEHAKFTRADFLVVHFESVADFMAARFNIEVEFHRAVFAGRTYFLHAEFATEKAAFKKVKFLDTAEFQFSCFDGTGEFDLCKFDKTANFARVSFGAGSFTETEFIGTTHFEHMKSTSTINFEKAIFRSETLFRDVEFEGGAIFRNTIFEKNTNFANGSLLSADFESARFLGDVTFSRTYFAGVQQFTYAHQNRTFTGVATFCKTFFGGTAYFTDALLGGPLDFSGAIFGGPVLFLLHPARGAPPQSRMKGGQSSRGTPAENPQPEDLRICFEEVFFGKPSSVLLNGVDLRHTTFAGANVRSVSFQNCAWPRVRTRFAVFDELCPLKNAEAVRLVYRDMKANYEDARDWVLAGDFYYGEMEILRKWRRGDSDHWSWLRRYLSPYSIYWLSSGYGEQPLRALWFFAALIFIFAFLFHSMAFTLDRSLLPTVSWTASLGYALRVLTLQRSFYIEPHSAWASSMTLLANLLGPLQLAQIAICLQRRFRR